MRDEADYIVYMVPNGKCSTDFSRRAQVLFWYKERVRVADGSEGASIIVLSPRVATECTSRRMVEYAGRVRER